MAKKKNGPAKDTADGAGGRRGWRIWRPRAGPVLRFGLKWGLVAGIWGVFIALCMAAWFATDLPDLGRLTSIDRKPSVTLLAADGSMIASYGDLYGNQLRLSDMPPYLRQAVIATEDRRFYDHFGIDPLGIAARHPDRLAGRPRRPGRQHDHPAARQEHLPDAGAHGPPQGPGGAAGAVARMEVQQGRDPGALSQPGLSRRRHLRRRCRGAEVFRQAGGQADHLRGGDPRRHAEGAVARQPAERPAERGGARPHRARQHGGGRLPDRAQESRVRQDPASRPSATTRRRAASTSPTGCSTRCRATSISATATWW